MPWLGEEPPDRSPTPPPVGLENRITVRGRECQRGTVNPAFSQFAPLRALYHGYWYNVRNASNAVVYFPTTSAPERVYTLYMQPDVASQAFVSRYLTLVQPDESSNASGRAGSDGTSNGGGAGSNGSINQNGGSRNGGHADLSSSGTRPGNSSPPRDGNNSNHNDYGNAVRVNTFPRSRHSRPTTKILLKPIQPPVPATGPATRHITTRQTTGKSHAAAGSPRPLIGNKKAPSETARTSPVVSKPLPVTAGTRNAARSGLVTSSNARGKTNTR